jgi:hypothetical protein
MPEDWLMAIDAGDTPHPYDDAAITPPEETSGSGMLVPMPTAVHQPTALHQMHDGRVVSHAGRMVAGSLVPVPTVKPSQRRSSSGRWQTTAGIVFAAFVFTFGATSLITSYLQNKRGVNDSARANTGATVNNTARKDAPVQTLAVSEVGEAVPKRELENSPLRIKETAPNSAMPQRASNLIVKNIVGASGQTLPMHLSVQRGQVEEYSFVMFRGVPKEVTISAGFRVKETWAVALQDVEQLTLATPVGFQGTFNLDVILIKGEDTPAEKRRMAVTIGKHGSMANSLSSRPGLVTASVQSHANSMSPSHMPSLQTSQKRPPLRPAQERAILNKAAVLINANNVASARLLFEYAANRGSAKAALAMGQTFDPAFFRTAEIIGLRPDPQKAKAWYKQAADLGNKEALNRLSALEMQ